MAYDREKNTAVLEDEDISDVIDERVQSNNDEEDDLGHSFKLQHNSFNEDDYDYDYNDESDEDEEEFEDEPQIKYSQDEKTYYNPFFGNNHALDEMRAKKNKSKKLKNTEAIQAQDNIKFSDALYEEDSTPYVYEEDSKEDIGNLPMSKTRKRLWLGTGICSGVLLVSLLACSIFSIGTINRDTMYSENYLQNQTQTVKDVGEINIEGQVIKTDAPTMTTEQVQTSDSFFNRLTKLIEYIFGK